MVYEWSFDEVRDEFTYITKEGCRFDDDWLVLYILDDEVEIIEEDKKLEKLKNLNMTKIDINKKGQVYGVTKEEMIADIKTLQNWVNKIIDKLNEMEKE